MSEIAIWVITSLLLGVGLAGTVIPAVPGIGLVFAGILFYAFVTGFAAISIPAVIIFGIVALIAWAADLAGSALGATAGGGKKFALIGAVVGAIIGLTTGPVGLLVGSFLGGLAGALIDGQNTQQAIRVAALSVVGVIGAAIFQFIVALAMIIAFLIAVFT